MHIYLRNRRGTTGHRAIDDFRFSIDYCISTQRTQRGKSKGRRQKTGNRKQRSEVRGQRAIDYFRLTIDYFISTQRTQRA